MPLQVRLTRDATIRPGHSTWFELPDSLLFVASADGMTQDGAECLEACWRALVDSGLWRWQAGGGGQPVHATYHHERPPSGEVAEVWSSGSGQVDVWLDPDHFVAETVAGLERMARAIARLGWTCHRQPAAQIAS